MQNESNDPILRGISGTKKRGDSAFVVGWNAVLDKTD